VHKCWFANHFECCSQHFKTKEELLQHQQTPGEHNPKRGVYAPYDVKWTLFKNGTAVCGNPGTGADSNGNLDAINFAIDRCLEERDLVIFDGVMSTLMNIMPISLFGGSASAASCTTSKTANAVLRSLGGPQMPSPVRRMAP
jgi:hypothetical protein